MGKAARPGAAQCVPDDAGRPVVVEPPTMLHVSKTDFGSTIDVLARGQTIIGSGRRATSEDTERTRSARGSGASGKKKNAPESVASFDRTETTEDDDPQMSGAFFDGVGVIGKALLVQIAMRWEVRC